MFREPSARGRGGHPARQRGFSLPVANLVSVLLSLLGAAMIALTSTGHRSVPSEVIGTHVIQVDARTP